MVQSTVEISRWFVLLVGYNFQCDVRQLAQSYGQLECFKQYEMLLDVQNVFKEPRGGLSGLAEVILKSFILLADPVVFPVCTLDHGLILLTFCWVTGYITLANSWRLF